MQITYEVTIEYDPTDDDPQTPNARDISDIVQDGLEADPDLTAPDAVVTARQ